MFIIKKNIYLYIEDNRVNRKCLLNVKLRILHSIKKENNVT